MKELYEYSDPYGINDWVVEEEVIRMIDPPSGWQYGFPKAIPDDVIDTMKWLVENGYPQKVIDSYGDHFYSRHWYERVKK
jgi:hypothetical protein